MMSFHLLIDKSMIRPQGATYKAVRVGEKYRKKKNTSIPFRIWHFFSITIRIINL